MPTCFLLHYKLPHAVECPSNRLYILTTFYKLLLFSFNFPTMALKTFKHEMIFKLVLSFAIFHTVIVGDADITSDLTVPPNVTNIDSNFFTFTGMRILLRAPPPTALKFQKQAWQNSQLLMVRVFHMQFYNS